jgi:hypothetical protein
MTPSTLDTSGRVGVPLYAHDLEGTHRLVEWSDLNPLQQGYVEALFERLPPIEYGEPTSGGYRLQRTPAFSDLAPETLRRIITDCEARLAQATPPYPNTRKEGARFWARRSAGDLRAHGFPPLAAYVALDDCKVCLREGAP